MKAHQILDRAERCCRIAFSCLVLASVSLNAAELEASDPDKIWLQPAGTRASKGMWYAESVQSVDGTVVKFDDRQVSIVQAGDAAAVNHAAYRVLWIQRGEMPEIERRAIELFGKKDYASALNPLLDALEQRPPVWRQQWLSMAAAQAAFRSGKYSVSLELVSQLDKRPLTPLVVGWLPIAWTNGRGEAASQQAALSRLNDDSVAVRLVCASWLLSSAQRADAIRALAQIKAEKSIYGVLAGCLLWRTATPPEAKQSASKWIESLEKLPLCLQIGPTVALVDKFKVAGIDSEARRLELSLQETPIAPHPDLP